MVLSNVNRAQPDTQEVPSEHEETLFVKGIHHWHRLPQETMETLSLERFKSYVDTVLVKWPYLIIGVGKGDLRCPCQHPPPYNANTEGSAHLLTAGAASSLSKLLLHQ